MKKKILIIASRDKRNRFRFITEPIRYSKFFEYDVYQNKDNILKFIWQSILFAYKHNYSQIIIVSQNFTALLWITLAKIVFNIKPTLRLAGELEVYKVRMKYLYKKAQIIKFIACFINYISTVLAIRFSDYIIVPNKIHMNSIKTLSKNDAKIFYIPQPVLIKKITEKDLAKKSNKNLGNDGVILLTVTNLDYYNKYIGCVQIIDNILWMKQNKMCNINIKYVIAGGGLHYSELYEYVSERIFNNEANDIKIVLKGTTMTKSVHKLYHNADIFVYNSTLDSSPNVLLEAQHFGLPILLNHFKPFHAMLEENKNGLFFDPKDKNDFSNKLLTLINNCDLRKRISFNNFHNIEHNYSTEAISKKLILFLTETI